MNFTYIDYWLIALLSILVIASLAMYLIKDLLHAVIVFGIYSVIMAIVWLQMKSPDLAITEAAAGISMSVLMMLVVLKTRDKEEEE